jgi:hypothetical protein
MTSLKIGARVRWQRGHAQGTVTQINGESLQIKWDNEVAPRWHDSNNIIPLDGRGGTIRMPLARTPYTFAVEGDGPFPLDMLRYDSCLPHTETDSLLIKESMRDDPGFVHKRIIVVKSYGQKPTKRRWETFGWTVLGVGMMRKHDGTVE